MSFRPRVEGLEDRTLLATSLLLSGFPAPATAGVAGNLTVTAQQAGATTDTAYTGTISFTSTDAQAALPANYTFTASDQGVHTFSVTLATASSQSLTATDTVTSTITGTESGITVNPAAASSLVVSAFASPSTAGTASNVTVTAKDVYGNTATGYLGTVQFTSSDAQAVLPANYAFVAADAGVHTLSATLKTAGSQSLTVTDTVTSTITGSQSGITVNPGSASSLVVSGFASPSTAGTAGTVTVTAKDAYGNTATGYTGTVHFTSSDAQAALAADDAFVAADAGVDTYSVTLKTAGSQSLTATDTVTSTITGSQSGISVNPASASSLMVSGFSWTSTAGTTSNVTVTAKDAYGNTATGYLGTIQFTSSDAQATLPANYTFVAADAGIHTLSATLKTAGSQSLTAADTGTSTISGGQSGITVNPAAASSLLVSGFASPATAGTTGTVRVTARDPYGNIATGYAGIVRFTSSDGQAVLPANYAFVAADAGIHTLSATLKTAGSQSLTATDTGASTISGGQNGITVNPAAASSLVVSGFASSSTAGTAGNVTVTAQDAYGNTATGYAGTVHFTSTDPQAALAANYTFVTADGGMHTLRATFKTAGSQSLTATDTVTSTITGSQNGITVNPATATSLVVSGFAWSSVAATPGNLTVTAKDAYGNTAAGYTGTVHFTSSDPQATLPANYTFVATDAGIHTVSAALKSTGSQSLTATDTVTSTITGSQSGITINPAAASNLVVSGFAWSSTAGTAGNVTVTAKDAYGNTATGYAGTVQFTSSDAQAALPANYAFVAADAGVHTFSATLRTAGSQSLTTTDTVTSTITGNQSDITVNPAVASSLVVSGFASPSGAGIAGNVTVTVKDAYGNTATAYGGTVQFTSSDAQATLPANYTFVAADAGIHTLSTTFKTAGSQSLTATDTVTSTITGSQSGITVNPAAASSLVVSGFAWSSTAGTASKVTVTAKDAYGNTATGYLGTVSFSSSDSQAALPASYAFVAADVGVHSFSATLKTAGSRSLTATDTVTSSITGTQNGITVNPAAAGSLTIVGVHSLTSAGMAGTVTVTAKDAYGNTATGYAGTVHFISSDAQATLPGDYTFVGADAGAHAFGVTLKTAGSQSLTVVDTVTATITGTRTGITVNPAAASGLMVSGFPSSTTAGVAGTFTVTAQDAYGNTATGYAGTAHFSSTGPQAILPADYTFAANDAGVHAFSATFKIVGTRSLTATDTLTSTISGSQSGITVNPAAASSLVVSGFPSSTTAGVAGAFAVTAQDAYGNTATGYAGTVHFSSTGPQAILPADYTFAANDAGVHAFSATFKIVGTSSLTATDAVTSTITGSQSGITINPAAASSLAVSGFASPGTAGVAGTVTVTAKDAYGNIATGYLGTVHIGSSDAQAVLPTNYTFVASDGGVHSFSATLKTAGAQLLIATDTITGTITGSQSGITINPAAASSLVLSGFPSAITVSLTSTFMVTAVDPYGNTATGYLNTVHFTSSDANAVLPADYTFVAADAGVHVFSATLKTVGTQSITVTEGPSPGLVGGLLGGVVGLLGGSSNLSATEGSITVRASSNAWTHPELITISFVPDGTVLTAGGVTSNLFATFNNKWSTATWENAILTAAQTWAQQANLNFEVVSDNGTKAGQGAYQQGDPGMGDIRIGGYSFGNSYLACTYLPGANNYSIAGDISFNTSQTFNVGSTYDLQTVALHEFGHAMGLAHTSSSTTVMYPYYNGIRRALSSTDTTNIQANYGARLPDVYNSNPQTANTSFATAASLNTLINPLNLTAVVNNLSINSTTQSEYFTFTAPWGTSNALKINAQSAGLSMFTPSLTVYAANQSTVLGSASSTVQYHGVTVSTSISSVTAGQQFYVKVSGVDSSAFSTGAFALTLNFGSGPGPTVTLPNTQTLDGAVLTGGGGLALQPPDFMSPSLDIVPPCMQHGGGCGCPACRTAALSATAAFDPYAQQRKEEEKHADQNNPTSTPEGWAWAARKASEAALATDDLASMAFWRKASDAWFTQPDLSEAGH